MRHSQPVVDFGWGLQDLQLLLPTSDAIVIVDVLSFSTAVDVATSRGTQVLPFPYGHSDAESYARSRRAVLAQPRLAGCLRNAAAVAQAASPPGWSIGVIAAGERWPDSSLRPAIEDLLGAGSTIHCLSAQPSPDAEAARAAWRALRSRIENVIQESQSGRELIDAGYAGDVKIATETDVSGTVPLLQGDAYVNAAGELPWA